MKIQSLIQDLCSGMSGRVLSSKNQVERYTLDFGRYIQKFPAVVVKALCEEDVVHALRVARAYDLPVTIRGGGHSCRGQSLSQGGVLIVNFRDMAQIKLEKGTEEVELDARSSWYRVELALNQQGRSVPALANYPDLSVGGTLSVGGYGTRSLAYGGQVDHVKKLRLVLPDGTALWCSSDDHQELFQYSLAGLGQVGVIEKVIMNTVPYDPLTVVYDQSPKSISKLLSSLEWLAGWRGSVPHHFCANVIQNKIMISYGTDLLKMNTSKNPLAGQKPMLTRDYIFRQFATQVDWLSGFKKHFRLWGDYIFNFDGFCSFMKWIDRGIKNGSLSESLECIYMLVVRRPQNKTAFPFEAGSIRAPILFGAGLYYMVPQNNAQKLKAARENHRRLLDRCVDLGGLPYLFGCQELDESMRQSLYGKSYQRLLELRAKLDPKGLFNTGKL